MAILSGNLQFTGTIDELSAYRLKATGKWVLRRKGGPSAERVKTGKEFGNTRKNNVEFSAAVLGKQQVVSAMQPVMHLSDYNYTGSLNGLCISIVKDDKVNPLGKRALLFSQYAWKLEGFSFNKSMPFGQYVKHPLQYSIRKEDAGATIVLPDIIPGINFTNPKKLPLYRLVFVLGAVSDIIYDEERNAYRPAAVHTVFPVQQQTDWHTWKETTPAQTIRLSLAERLPPSTLRLPPSTLSPVPFPLSPYTLLLSAGIEFGKPVSSTVVQTEKKEGAVKLLMMR